MQLIVVCSNDKQKKSRCKQGLIKYFFSTIYIKSKAIAKKVTLKGRIKEQ